MACVIKHAQYIALLAVTQIVMQNVAQDVELPAIWLVVKTVIILALAGAEADAKKTVEINV